TNASRSGASAGATTGAGRDPAGRGHVRRLARALAQGVALFAGAPALSIATMASASSATVDILRPTGALPVAIATSLRDPAAFLEMTTGESVVFDRRAGVVEVVDAPRTSARVLVSTAPDQGRLVTPSAVAGGPASLMH